MVKKQAGKSRQNKIIVLYAIIATVIAVTAIALFLLQNSGGSSPQKNAYMNLWSTLVKIETDSGVPSDYALAVPHIIIVHNYSIKAIVIGEVQDKAFWDSLLINATRANAKLTPVYLGSNRIKYINTSVDTLIELVRNIVTDNAQHIILFGLTTCPHCHNMYVFFNKYYPSIFTVFWLDQR